MSKLCEHTSVVITTHLNFAEGSAACVYLKMTTARWDRPWHHGHSVETSDESCRVTQVTTRTKQRIKAREQDRRGLQSVAPPDPA